MDALQELMSIEVEDKPPPRDALQELMSMEVDDEPIAPKQGRLGAAVGTASSLTEPDSSEDRRKFFDSEVQRRMQVMRQEDDELLAGGGIPAQAGAAYMTSAASPFETPSANLRPITSQSRPGLNRLQAKKSGDKEQYEWYLRSAAEKQLHAEEEAAGAQRGARVKAEAHAAALPFEVNNPLTRGAVTAVTSLGATAGRAAELVSRVPVWAGIPGAEAVQRKLNEGVGKIRELEGVVHGAGEIQKEQSVLPKEVNDVIEGVSHTLTTVGLAGFAGKAGASQATVGKRVIGLFGAEAYAGTYDQATQAGLSEVEAQKAAVTQGVIAAGSAAVLMRVFGKQLNVKTPTTIGPYGQIIPGQVSGKLVAKEFAMIAGETGIFAGTTYLAEYANEKFGLGPIPEEGLGTRVAKAFATLIGLKAGGAIQRRLGQPPKTRPDAEIAAKAKAWAAENPEAARKLAQEEVPSRGAFERAEVPERMNEQERAAYQDAVKSVVPGMGRGGPPTEEQIDLALGRPAPAPEVEPAAEARKPGERYENRPPLEVQPPEPEPPEAKTAPRPPEESIDAKNAALRARMEKLGIPAPEAAKPEATVPLKAQEAPKETEPKTKKTPLTEEEKRLLQEIDDPRARGPASTTGPTKTQEHLGELVGNKPVFHETSLRSAVEIYGRIRNYKSPAWNMLYVSDNLDLALGQGNKGYIFEFDSTRLNGSRKPKIGTGLGLGDEYVVSKSAREAVDAITFRTQRQLQAFKSRFPNSLDYDNASNTERGIRVPAKASKPPVAPEAAKPARPVKPVAPEEAAKTVDSVRQQLLDKGYKAEAVDAMTPEEMQRALRYKSPRKAKPKPKAKIGEDFEPTPEQEADWQRKADEAFEKLQKENAAKAKPAEAAPEQPSPAKEPWQMTQAEFNSASYNTRRKSMALMDTPEIRSYAKRKNVASDEWIDHALDDALAGTPAIQKDAVAALKSAGIQVQNVGKNMRVAGIVNEREWVVRQAVAAGKPVPPEVLADYPGLLEQAKTVSGMKLHPDLLKPAKPKSETQAYEPGPEVAPEARAEPEAYQPRGVAEKVKGGAVEEIPLSEPVAGEKPVKTYSPVEILKTMSYRLFPIIKRKLTGTRQGQYNTQTHVSNIQNARNLRGGFHETGHAIDKVEGIVDALPADIKAELATKDYVADRGDPKEGFGEYLAHRLGYDDAATFAPKFHRYFESYLVGRGSKYAKPLAQIKELTTNYRQAGAVARTEAHTLRLGEKPEAVRTRWERFKDRLESMSEGAWEGAKDESLGALRFQQALPEQPKGNRFYDDIQQHRLKSESPHTEAAIFDGVKTIDGRYVGMSMKEVMGPLAKATEAEQSQAETFAYARHALERWSKGQDPGIPEAEAKRVFDQLNTPENRAFAERLTEFNNSLIEVLYDAGKITEVERDAMLEWKTFVPNWRGIDSEYSFGQGKGGSGKKGGDLEGPFTIKRRTGGGDMVVNVVDATLARVRKIYAEAAKQSVINEAIKQAVPAEGGAEGMGEWIDLLPRGAEQKADPARGYHDLIYKGEERVAFVKPELMRAFGAMDTKAIPKFVQYWSFFTRLKKLGATGAFSPTFNLASNPMEDFSPAMVKTSRTLGPTTAAKPWAWWAKMAYAQVTGKTNPLIDLYMNNAGRGAGQLEETPASIDFMKNRLMGRKLKLLKSPNDLLKMAERYIGLAEHGPRLMEFESRLAERGYDAERIKEMRARGEQPPMQDLLYALEGAREITTNFKRLGTWGGTANKISPYFNAPLEGTASFARAIRDNPARAGVRLGMLGLATAAYWFANKDKDWYKKQKPWLRKYWRFDDPTGDGEDERVAWHMPRGRGVDVLTGAFESALNMLYQKDKSVGREIGEMLEYAVESTTPLKVPGQFKDVPLALNISVLTPMLEAAMGYDGFRESDLVPRSKQHLRPGDQSSTYNLEIMKAIGKKYPGWFNPAKVEHVLDSLSGGIVRGVGKFAENVAMGKSPFKEKSDIPVLKAFMERGEYVTPIDDLYEAREDAKRKLASGKLNKTATEEQRKLNWKYELAADVVGDIKALTVDVEGKAERFEIEKYAIGTAMAALGEKPLKSYPSIFTLKKLTPELEEIRVKLRKKIEEALNDPTPRTKEQHEDYQSALQHAAAKHKAAKELLDALNKF